MLLNISNHPSDQWPETQYSAAVEQFGSVEDLPFPNVPAQSGIEDVQAQAELLLQRIKQLKPDAVFVMGEHTLTYQIVEKLKNAGILALAVTSERIDQRLDAERSIKTFRFHRFRPYFPVSQ